MEGSKIPDNSSLGGRSDQYASSSNAQVGRSSYAPAPQELEFPAPSEEVAKAIYAGQLSMAPLAASSNPLESVKSKCEMDT